MTRPHLPATAFVSEGLETAWNGSGYFRQAMATLGVTLFVTTDDGRRHRTDNRIWRFPRIEGDLTQESISNANIPIIL